MMAQKAMGAESGRVRTHVDTTQKSMYITPEVLHGVLYPKVHNNGFEKKKKKYVWQSWEVGDGTGMAVVWHGRQCAWLSHNGRQWHWLLMCEGEW